MNALYIIIIFLKLSLSLVVRHLAYQKAVNQDQISSDLNTDRFPNKTSNFCT